jgi:hypothetical protein
VDVWYIGGMTEPVIGSGVCPAWIAKVSNPASLFALIVSRLLESVSVDAFDVSLR